MRNAEILNANTLKNALKTLDITAEDLTSAPPETSPPPPLPSAPHPLPNPAASMTYVPDPVRMSIPADLTSVLDTVSFFFFR